MPVKVLIVDDSGFFRHRIREMLSDDPRLEVVGAATNGREAVEKVKLLRPDVVTMDVEMPEMNGIEAVRVIMREAPTSVLMLSSLTHEGARVTLQALEAGAADYLPKDIRAWMDKGSDVKKQLVDRLVALGRSRRFRRSLFADQDRQGIGREDKSRTLGSAGAVARRQISPYSAADTPVRRSAETAQTRQAAVSPAASARNGTGRALRSPSQDIMPDCKLVVIAASTGGPAALQKILTELPASFPHPILLVQHMPKTFTQVFAERLNQQCQISVKEAEDGDRLQPGHALLAPGGQQMIIDSRHPDRVRILPGDERLTYKPSADVTYASAARTYGSRVLGITLTGMGSDGCDGSRLLKQAGSTQWAQSRESCTIYGMPQAVVNAGLADAILDLEDIGPLLAGRKVR